MEVRFQGFYSQKVFWRRDFSLSYFSTHWGPKKPMAYVQKFLYFAEGGAFHTPESTGPCRSFCADPTFTSGPCSGGGSVSSSPVYTPSQTIIAAGAGGVLFAISSAGLETWRCASDHPIVHGHAPNLRLICCSDIARYHHVEAQCEFTVSDCRFPIPAFGLVAGMRRTRRPRPQQA